MSTLVPTLSSRPPLSGIMLRSAKTVSSCVACSPCDSARSRGSNLVGEIYHYQRLRKNRRQHHHSTEYCCSCPCPLLRFTRFVHAVSFVKSIWSTDHLRVGRFIEDLTEFTQEMVEAHAKQYYTRFRPMER